MEAAACIRSTRGEERKEGNGSRSGSAIRRMTSAWSQRLGKRKYFANTLMQVRAVGDWYRQ